MITALYTGITTGSEDGVKIKSENIAVRYKYTGATDLIIYTRAGITPDDMQEIVTADSTQATRITATGAGTRLINISGLTPGMYVGIGVDTGTGTVTADILSGS